MTQPFAPFESLVHTRVNILGHDATWRRVADLSCLDGSDVLQAFPENLCTGEISLLMLPPNFGFLVLWYKSLVGRAELQIDSEPLMKIFYTFSRGNGVAAVRGYRPRYRFSHDSGMLLSPSAASVVFPDQQGEYTRIICLLVNPSLVVSVLGNQKTRIPLSLSWLLDENRPEPEGVPVSAGGAIHQVLYQIEACSFESQLRKLYFEGKAFELLGLTLERVLSRHLRGADSELSRRDSERMTEAVDIINANLRSPPTLAELSEKLRISPVKLKRDFPLAVGMTVHAYIIDRRLDTAARLLRDRDIGVKQAAYEVGYRNLSHFSFLFKQRYGLSPSDYGDVYEGNGATEERSCTSSR